MQRRFIQLVIRARRLVTGAPGTPAPSASPGVRPRLTGRRQLGSEVTQFSFRLAFVIDLAYVGVGALGGAVIGRAAASPAQATEPLPVSCGSQVVASPHSATPGAR